MQDWLYKPIENVEDIKTAILVDDPLGKGGVANTMRSLLGIELRVMDSFNEALSYSVEVQPDMILVNAESRACGDGLDLSRSLRRSGYTGIVVLLTDDPDTCGGTSNITSAGFDNYMLNVQSPSEARDVIHWAILNRKRRNKYSILFDESPEKLYTLDARGRIYDINRVATEGTHYTPQQVVRGRVNIETLGNMPFFGSIVKPLIKPENITRLFSNTVHDKERVYQLKTRVHNVPTMGLVATVVVSDITATIFSHTMDLMINSVTMLSQRDNYTASHSMRVYHYSQLIASEMGLGESLGITRPLYLASLLHDIGKIGIRDNILLKPGNLTDDEFRELCTHPVRGHEMLSPYTFLDQAGELVLSHHERPDGYGYPGRLGGGHIPIGASIVAVADGFDAMTTSRPYREPRPYEEAIAEIRENLAIQFDREAGRAFLSLISPELMHKINAESQKSFSVLSAELVSDLIKDY